MVLNSEIIEGNHPTDDTLEEYFFQRLPEQHQEVLETHLLTCQWCLGKFDNVELDITTMKLALKTLQAENTNEIQAPHWSWLAFPGLRYVAAAGLVTICVSLPHITRRSVPISEVSLHAYRGSDVAVVPQQRITPLLIDATDLPEGVVSVQVVDLYGAQVWTGRSEIHKSQTQVVLPRLSKDGPFFLRLYGSHDSQDGPMLLREFVFNVE